MQISEDNGHVGVQKVHYIVPMRLQTHSLMAFFSNSRSSNESLCRTTLSQRVYPRASTESISNQSWNLVHVSLHCKYEYCISSALNSNIPPLELHAFHFIRKYSTFPIFSSK